MYSFKKARRSTEFFINSVKVGSIEPNTTIRSKGNVCFSALGMVKFYNTIPDAEKLGPVDLKSYLQELIRQLNVPSKKEKEDKANG